MIILIIILTFLSYLVGAIPTGYVIARYFFHIDITKHGSGNIGATNVARVLGGVRYFILVFCIDMAKAFGSLFLTDMLLQRYYAQHYINNILLVCAMILLLGNAHSVFLRFKGGKGVATTIGIIAYLITPPLLLFFIMNWLLLVGLTRQVFVASIGAMVSLVAMYTYLFYAPDNLLMYFLFSLLVWIVWRHKSNLKAFLFL